MKLPFVSRRKYENARNNLSMMTQARSQIEKAYKEYQAETREKDIKRNTAYSQMEDNCKQLCNRLEYYECKLDSAKKEIKRLKTLCTRNGVKYKEEEE